MNQYESARLLIEDAKRIARNMPAPYDSGSVIAVALVAAASSILALAESNHNNER